MAELGVVASIVNIVDLTAKVAVAATRYAEKVKNVKCASIDCCHVSVTNDQDALNGEINKKY